VIRGLKIMEKSIERVADEDSDNDCLHNNLCQIVLGTWESAKETNKAFLNNNEPLKNKDNYRRIVTNNIAAYWINDMTGDANFAIVGPKGNPLANEKLQKSAYNCLKKSQFYIPSKKIEGLIKNEIESGNAFHAPYNWLNMIEGNNAMQAYVQSGKNNNDVEKHLFASILGIYEPREGRKIVLMSGDAIKEALLEKPDRIVLRACAIDYQGDFLADHIPKKHDYRAVRGVRIQQEESIQQAQL
jgi:hypothetical protein